MTQSQPLEHTRERLLQAAIRRFSERGFGATTVKQIAADVGLRAPAIYNHYSSKEELLLAATTWALDAFQIAVLGPDNPERPAPERLEGLVRRHIRYQLENLDIARANDLVLDEVTLQEVLPSELVDGIRKRMRGHLDLATELVSQSQSDGSSADARLCALAIVTMSDRVSSWYRPGGRFSIDDVCDTYWGLAAAMLR
jgi:TetR/AcrR family transcriptional regulator, cholesterol catabolism regulator